MWPVLGNAYTCAINAIVGIEIYPIFGQNIIPDEEDISELLGSWNQSTTNSGN